jgi:hypothetical protein
VLGRWDGGGQRFGMAGGSGGVVGEGVSFSEFILGDFGFVAMEIDSVNSWRGI